MRSIQLVIALSFILSAANAFADHDGKGEKNGPCKTYMETCKSDPSVTGAADKKAKWAAMHSCVTTAATADKANGQACMDAQAKHKHN